MKLRTINRFHAFGWHLLASSCIALVSTMLVFLFWYPGPLALASGVRDIFFLLLLVDIVLGPVITLIIFNRQKKELKRDLIIVALVQLTALLYGLQAVYVARPVYVVFSIDRFDLVFANDFTDEKLDKVSKTEYGSLPRFGPKVIAARRPDDIKARNELLFGSLSGGEDLPQLPQYYVPYDQLKSEVIRRAHPLVGMKEFNTDKLSAIDSLINKYRATKVDAGYLPLRGKVKDLVVIVNRTTGDLLEIVDFDAVAVICGGNFCIRIATCGE